MSEVEKIISKCDKKNRIYLESYLENAPYWVTESLQVVKVPKGTSFIEEGNKVDSVYFLIEGNVVAVDYRVREIVYGFYEFKPIEIFGAMEILGDMKEYKATLVAKDECLFLKLNSSLYKKWLCNDINALLIQTKRMSTYLVEEARKERLNILLSATERMALVLIRMYELYAENRQSKVYLSRKYFVETTGLSERTITRILTEFETKGMITREGWNIVLTEEQYLTLKQLVDIKINKMGDE